MKRRKFLLCIVFIFTGVSIGTWAPVGAFELEKGEKLTFSTKFFYIIPLGNATLEVKDVVDYSGKKVFLITCKAKTAKWISLLFKAEAILTSYIDIDKLHPYKFEQILKVAGKPDDVRRATYDRVKNIMEAEGKGKKKVPPDVKDPISAIYYLRAQELKEGTEIKQMVNNNQSTYIFSSKIMGKKKIDKFTCWILDATVRRENKSMYHSMDVIIYISDDERRLPVAIKAKTKIGLVSLRLISEG